MLDKSLRIKSTSIRCSERSLISAIIEAIIAKSSDLLAPRVTVPLIGAVDKILSLQRNSVSGEDDTIARPKSTASMYAENGAGLDIVNRWNIVRGCSTSLPDQKRPKFT